MKMQKIKKIVITVLVLGSNLYAQQEQAVAVDEQQESELLEQASPQNVEQKELAISESMRALVPSDAVLVDTIEAVVFAPEGTKVITKSELDRPGLDGRMRTINDLVLERLLLLEAQKFKMVPDDETIDKYLSNIQRENNLTLDALKKIFKSAGYSYEEGREQFGMMSIVNQVLDFKIRSRLIVPEKEVVAYYKENPEIIEASYWIQRAVIPFDSRKSVEVQRAEIQRKIDHTIGLTDIEWQAPFWINDSEIAQDKRYIIALQPGQISAPQIVDDGFEIFQLKEAKETHERPLQERYRDIVELLRKPKYEQLMEEYKKQLFDAAAVLYF